MVKFYSYGCRGENITCLGFATTQGFRYLVKVLGLPPGGRAIFSKLLRDFKQVTRLLSARISTKWRLSSRSPPALPKGINMFCHIQNTERDTRLLSLLLILKSWQPVPRKMPSALTNHTPTGPLAVAMPLLLRREGGCEGQAGREWDSWKELLLWLYTEDRSSGPEGSGGKVSYHTGPSTCHSGDHCVSACRNQRRI